MKIATWNVNGLRAVISKGLFAPVLGLNLDILCLQEVKARPEQLDETQRQFSDGLFAYWNPGDRPGYSGVATLCLAEPEACQLGMNQPAYDLEGRLIATRQAGFWLFNVYFPNGQRDHGRLTYKLEFYARLLDLVDDLHRQGEQVIICGDFNTAHKEIDLRNPKQNANTSGFLPEEREWIDRYLSHGLVDAYRILYPDRVEYTWWTYRMQARQRNIGWRLDYFLVSEGLMNRVRDVIIRGDLQGSDHCPVILELSD